MNSFPHCRNCGEQFDPDGTRRKYCSNRCKQTTYRKRRAEAERAAAILFANVTDTPPAPHVLTASSSSTKNAVAGKGGLHA